MATANLKRDIVRPNTHEGATASLLTPEAQLRRSVMSCLLWENEFYEDGQSIAKRIESLVSEVDPHAVADIAVEAREDMHLRHVPLWIVRGMARELGGTEHARLVGDVLARVIQRPDELCEFVALYWKDGKEPLSAQVKKGLAEAFRKFDEYQLAKYNRTDRAVTLRDVLFLCHAKPKDEEQEALWGRLIADELETPDTWETRLSAGEGEKSDEAKRERWTSMLESGKLGAMALLRNLRNMLDVNVERGTIERAIREARYRRVLPFRFIAAARHAPKLENALNDAMLGSLSQLPKLQGRTCIVVDHSGSMRAPVSSRSTIDRFDAACGVSMILRQVCNEVSVLAFSAPSWGGKQGTAWVPPRRGFALRDALYAAMRWGGTDLGAAVQVANQEPYDRIVVLTDEQSMTLPGDPRPGTNAYLVNVASAKNGVGYGRWTHIDGWSESVVRFITELEGLAE